MLSLKQGFTVLLWRGKIVQKIPCVLLFPDTCVRDCEFKRNELGAISKPGVR